ncbi:hypothetical protein [Leptothoe spongobia]|uniref:Uncharacterized protein n=1 Tax=Leptothoe spongobia TAU-MAC 1115 TaxID=1967444 RepID=A0A947GPB3_9CYAN|nr:hypothetical protein [Leptothoe spongobia]MBT9316466.1 hypothetical protein [Leptothoe spongobia TAU-MAC 1115]
MMKAPVVLGSLLALAGTAATAESADAAISDVVIQEDLKQAVCSKDWYKAIEVSSKLITSPTITPDYRQQLLDWRRQFYTHIQGGTKADAIPGCAEFKAALADTKTPAFQGPEPRFSKKKATTSGKTVAPFPLDPVAALTDIWTVGVRIEGNNIKGTIFNNGLTTANNVTLTIRSQQEDRSEDIRTVAIDTVRAWDEADFVAAFNDTPGSWLIESIEVN